MKYFKMLLRNEMMQNTEDPQVCMEKVGKSGKFQAFAPSLHHMLRVP